MKLIATFLFLFAAACGAFQPVDAAEVAREAVAAADRDRDGQLSKDEIRQAKNDPMFWITFGTAILSVLGIGGAAAAGRKARQVEIETDQQWDEIRKPLP